VILIGSELDTGGTCTVALDLCAFFNACGPNANCRSATTPNIRVCTCDPGWTTPANFTGYRNTFQLVGAESWSGPGAKNCSVDFDECSLNTVGFPAKGCVTDDSPTQVIDLGGGCPANDKVCCKQAPSNGRFCTCPTGYLPVIPSQTPSHLLVGTAIFGGCTNASNCDRYGCLSQLTSDTSTWSSTTDCFYYGNDVRKCTCKPGYTSNANGVNLTGATTFATCADINECDLYGCGPDTACENLQNSRNCSCPFGTTTLSVGLDYEVVVGSAPTSVRCKAIDFCSIAGCYDPIHNINRTCTPAIAMRTCSCPDALIGTLTLDLEDPFPGCFPKLTIGPIQSLGYTLDAGYWCDWDEAIQFDVNGDGKDDLFVIKAQNTVVGWMENILSPSNMREHLSNGWSTSTCFNARLERVGGVLKARCIEASGNTLRLRFDPQKNQFVDDLPVTKKRIVVAGTMTTIDFDALAGDADYTRQTQVCSTKVGSVTWTLAGRAQYLLEEQADLTIIEHKITLDINPIANNRFLDVVADCALVDFDNDGDLDLAIALSSTVPANNGFFWYRRTGTYSFQLVDKILTTASPSHLEITDLDASGSLDMLMVTTDCYTMSILPNISTCAPCTPQLVAGQDGSCSTCGCGSSGGLHLVNFNNDEYPDFISLVSGGAELFLNYRGRLYLQTLLGGCDTISVYDLTLDGVPDLICSASGVAILYPFFNPNSCQDGAHACDPHAGCIDLQWEGYDCACHYSTDVRNPLGRWTRNETAFTETGFVECIDIDECAMDATLCLPNPCMNTLGSFRCACPNFYGYDENCLDINECSTGFTSGCVPPAKCRNEAGSYTCECPDFYEPDWSVPNPNNRTGDPPNDNTYIYNVSVACKDIDQCLLNNQSRTLDPSIPALCDQICLNIPGFYECRCDVGWVKTEPLLATSPSCSIPTCHYETWSQWSPNCDCGLIQTRRREEAFIELRCGFPNTTQNEIKPCNISLFCKPPEEIPNSLATADSIISKFLSPLTVNHYFPGWRRIDNLKKRQTAGPLGHIAGTYELIADECTGENMTHVRTQLQNMTSTILSLPYSKILMSHSPSVGSANSTGVLTDCSVTMDISGSYPFDPTAVLVGVLVAVPLSLLIIFLLWRYFSKLALERKLEVLMNLPEAITKHYKDCILHPEQWEKLENEPVLFRKLLVDKRDIEHVTDIFTLLDGSSIKVNQIYAVFNPSLVSQMGLTWEKFENRVATNPQLFYAEKWRNDEKATRTLTKQRAWVKNVFVQRVASFVWNQELSVPIIPTIHGTSAHVAWKVCQSGFATLSALDIGFFGAGIYFTTSAKYAVPYFATKPNPAIIISYLVPGNPFPVTENPNDPSISMAGHPIKPGYQSHYVLTTNRGMPFERVEYKHIFDEIVIRQETQVAPAYILMLDPRSFPNLIRAFERMTSEDDPANFEQND